MIASFESDYANGAHDAILRRIVETNDETLATYGDDFYTERAKERIRAACSAPDAGIFLIAGGTLANGIALDMILDRYEAVVAPSCGHILTHEAGIVEASGHKIIGLPHVDGKLDADAVARYLDASDRDANARHQPRVGAIYTSQATEFGAVYSASELEDLARACHDRGRKLYVDGARICSAIASTDGPSLADIAKCADAFYIGGTKAGLLMGGAIIFPRGEPRDLFTSIKRAGAVFAKGRALGVQFDAFFEDDLYLSINRRPIELADRLRSAFEDRGFEFASSSPTNQIFVIMSDSQIARAKEKIFFRVCDRVDDDRSIVRFVTSWSTTDEEVEAAVDVINELS